VYPLLLGNGSVKIRLSLLDNGSVEIPLSLLGNGSVETLLQLLLIYMNIDIIKNCIWPAEVVHM
jgi:hypothetical protein